MIDYDFLKKYVFDIKSDNWRNSKHAFFQLDKKEIAQAEEIMGIKFPNSLKIFYESIGYGFACNKDNVMSNRLMDPDSVAKLWKEKLDTQTQNSDSIYKLLHFFEADDDSYIYMDLNEVDSIGEAPIYYYGIQIAQNLQEFFMRLDRRPNFYLNIATRVIDSEKQ